MVRRKIHGVYAKKKTDGFPKNTTSHASWEEENHDTLNFMFSFVFMQFDYLCPRYIISLVFYAYVE